MNGEAELPRDVSPMEGGGFNFLWGVLFGLPSAGVRHGTVFKFLRE